MLKDLIRKFVKGTLSAARTSSGEFLLKKTDFGIVHVEFSVVKKIAEQAVLKINGIHDVEIAVERFSGAVAPMKIRITATLAENYSAPRVSEAIDKVINDALKESLNLEFYVPIAVKVRQITPPVTQKRRRVR